MPWVFTKRESRRKTQRGKEIDRERERERATDGETVTEGGNEKRDRERKTDMDREREREREKDRYQTIKPFQKKVLYQQYSGFPQMRIKNLLIVEKRKQIKDFEI